MFRGRFSLSLALLMIVACESNGTGTVRGDADASGAADTGGEVLDAGAEAPAYQDIFHIGLWDVVDQSWIGDVVGNEPLEVLRSALPAVYTVCAATPETLPEGMGSVSFDVNGQRFSVDNDEPSFLTPIPGGNASAWASGSGTFTVTVTRYSGFGGQGTVRGRATRVIKILE